MAIGPATSTKYQGIYKYFPALAGILLIPITIAAVFGESVNGLFLNWDDTQWIVGNCTIRYPSIEGALRLFLPATHEFYQPVTFLSWMLDYSINGLDPYYFHFNNLLYYSIAGLLLQLLLSR